MSLIMSFATGKRLMQAPHSLLFKASTAAVVLLAAPVSHAVEWTQGKALWDNVTACSSCHDAARLTAMRATFANMTVAQTRARIQTAADSFGGMGVVFNAFSIAQKDQVATYVADFRAEGNVSANPGATLSVSAVGQSTSTVITLFNNGRAPLIVATNNGVRLSGTGAAQFSVAGVGSGCLAQTLAPAASCQVRVTYQPNAAPATQHQTTLTIEHNGEPSNTTTLAITGAIAAAPPPPPPANSGGGGALPLALWATLLPAGLLARRARRGGVPADPKRGTQ
jgi:hypothetical protein